MIFFDQEAKEPEIKAYREKLLRGLNEMPRPNAATFNRGGHNNLMGGFCYGL